MAEALLFDELLDGLRREGFSVGTDQYLRMHALVERHPDASPQQLKTLLCPLFAMSAAEQERFHVAYDEYFAGQTVPGHTMAGQSARAISLRRITVADVPLPPAVKPRPAIRWRLIGAIVATIVVAVLAVAFWPEKDTLQNDDAAEVATDPQTADPQPDERSKPSAPIGAWLFIGALTLFAAEVARTALRWMRQREHRAQGRPFDWPVRDPHPTAPRLFADQRFFALARLMKGREVGEVRRLDVPRSIVATIRALGDPTFAYKHDRHVTEYLFLVERRSERDHLAAYLHTMIEALMREGALIEVFEHDGDPRHCWKPGTNARIATADLHSRFPQHRLIIVGNAVALTNPVTGEALESIPRLFPWNFRAILTPESETRARNRFEAYFDVYALADSGLMRLAERWIQTEGPPPRRRIGERRRFVIELPSTPAEIERELDPLLFHWLLRCSVHPTLHWDLTRELAPPLPAAEHETALLDLARLEWFRQGRIPEAERLALVSRLSEETADEAAARAAAQRVLAAAPPPPPGSTASRAFEIQQLAHRIWTARDDRAALRPLIRKLRHYPPSQIARDSALMMLLEEAPGTVVSRNLPQRWRKFFFKGGIPAFGMQNFVAIAALLPVMVFALQSPAPDPPSAGARPPETQATFEPPPPDSIAAPISPPATTETTETTATAPIVVAGTEAPLPEIDKTPKPVEPPKLAELPTLIAPIDRTITIENARQPVVFSWKPLGSYTLHVVNAQGKDVYVAKVTGTRASWHPRSASSGNAWFLRTKDGRATPPVKFNIAYSVPELPVSTTPPPTAPIRTYRTVEATLPVSCGKSEGVRDVDLRLSAREQLESIDFKVLNAEAFEVADVSPGKGSGSFVYRFVAKQPCKENTLEARVRVTATIQLLVAGK
ncbi:MAG TPA: hypothetical protein VF111_03545 [Thermoanaerobaculia bacterium]